MESIKNNVYNMPEPTITGSETRDGKKVPIVHTEIPYNNNPRSKSVIEKFT
jgi:hypothetical protein